MVEFMIRSELAGWILILAAVGYVIKHKTLVPNSWIPVILFGVAFLVASVWGYLTSLYAGAARWVDALVMCGLVQGLVITAIATYGWDVIHGFLKYGVRGRRKKKDDTEKKLS